MARDLHATHGREVSRGPRGVPCSARVAVPFIVIRGISPPFLGGDLTTFKGNILAPIPAKDNLFRGPRLLVWSELFSEEMLMRVRTSLTLSLTLPFQSPDGRRHGDTFAHPSPLARLRRAIPLRPPQQPQQSRIVPAVPPAPHLRPRV